MFNQALSNNLFHDAEGRTFGVEEVICAVKSYIGKHPESHYEIVIGSDSEAALKGSAYFVTAVVVRRIGNGGVHFWTGHEEKFYSFRDRIWREAILSITLAQEFRTLLRDALGPEMLWEGRIEFKCIHLDIGEDGPTREFVDGLSGMVKGYGFIPVIKPYSYGAFVVADRHT